MKHLVNWFKSLFRKDSYVVPTYYDVMSALTVNELHDCMVCLEVLMRANNKQFAEHRLHSVCDKHNWSYKVFMDIIEEEYNDLHWK